MHVAGAGAGIAAAVSKTEVLDASLEKLFGTVRERFLGDKKMVDDAIQAYVAWKPIRAEVARLSLIGRELGLSKDTVSAIVRRHRATVPPPEGLSA